MTSRRGSARYSTSTQELTLSRRSSGQGVLLHDTLALSSACPQTGPRRERSGGLRRSTGREGGEDKGAEGKAKSYDGLHR
eukprot:9841388-Alexandrium_andersonii.AAC.1